MKTDALTLNMMHHLTLFIAFVYWSKTLDTWMAFGIISISIFIGYFLD
ncbi:MAG: hypothetical protein WC376_02590 [Candidatus Nanoarchaeia archaeon]